MELIGTSFQNEHTALLARATLARMLPQLSIDSRNVALVYRKHGGSIELDETIGIGGKPEIRPHHKSFWNTLVSLLTMPDTAEKDSLQDPTSSRLSAIGIDKHFKENFLKSIPEGSSAILLLVDDPQIRDRVLGVLRAFSRETNRVKLNGDNREIWHEILSDQPDDVQNHA